MENSADVESNYPLFFSLVKQHFDDYYPKDKDLYCKFLDILSTPRVLMSDDEWITYILKTFLAKSVQLKRMFRDVSGIKDSFPSPLKESFEFPMDSAMNDDLSMAFSPNDMFSDYSCQLICPLTLSELESLIHVQSLVDTNTFSDLISKVLKQKEKFKKSKLHDFDINPILAEITKN